MALTRTYRRAGQPCSILVGESSQLAAALNTSASAGAKVYDETAQRFEALYGKEDAKWFMDWPLHRGLS